jgi:hypothetical protein
MQPTFLQHQQLYAKVATVIQQNIKKTKNTVRMSAIGGS